MTLLSLQDVHIGYGGIKAVKGIDLHVDAGELVTLIGANGAGKTTTLKAICGLLKPSAGAIQYSGRNPRLAGLPPEAWHRWIAPDWAARGWNFRDD